MKLLRLRLFVEFLRYNFRLASCICKNMFCNFKSSAGRTVRLLIVVHFPRRNIVLGERFHNLYSFVNNLVEHIHANRKIGGRHNRSAAGSGKIRNFLMPVVPAGRSYYNRNSKRKKRLYISHYRRRMTELYNSFRAAAFYRTRNCLVISGRNFCRSIICGNIYSYGNFMTA